MANRIHIGTSGWVYKNWAKDFYPEEIPAKLQFEFYATQFGTVEINASFYRLPSENMVAGWKAKAPPGFIFALKGSRYLTHMLKLKNAEEGLETFFERIKPLKPRLGPVLWQLPPSLHADKPRLDDFLAELPRGYQYAVEFRHPSWLNDEIFGVLKKHGAAHVSVSSLAMPMNLTTTAKLVYVRFHGLKGGAAHNYTCQELEPWARHLSACARKGLEAFVYFNNDVNVCAPKNARMLREMVSGTGPEDYVF